MANNEAKNMAAGAANQQPAAGTAGNQIIKKTALPFKGEIRYVREDGDIKERVQVYMLNPFGDKHPIDPIRLTFAKPDKKNNKGFSVADRGGAERGGLFEYFAKLAFINSSPLVIDGVIPFTGEITYRSFVNSRGNYDYTFISINSPFPESIHRLWAYCRNAADDGVFDYLAKERLELIHESPFDNH